MPASDAQGGGPHYVLRLFPDPGSGICLWAGNDAARARFGYPVEPTQLDLPPALAADLEAFVADYDAVFPWDDPGVRDPHRLAALAAEDAVFAQRINALLLRLKQALGQHFTVEKA